MKKNLLGCIAAFLFGLLAFHTVDADAATAGAWVEVEADSDTVEATISTNGKTSYGKLELSFDSDKLTVEEDDVKFEDESILYSVHVTEDGSLVIAFLSEQPVTKGELLTVKFTIVDDDYDVSEFALAGTAYSKDGKALEVAKAPGDYLEVEAVVPAPSSGSGKEDSGSNNAGKGDAGKGDAGKGDAGKGDEGTIGREETIAKPTDTEDISGETDTEEVTEAPQDIAKEDKTDKEDKKSETQETAIEGSQTAPAKNPIPWIIAVVVVVAVAIGAGSLILVKKNNSDR